MAVTSVRVREGAERPGRGRQEDLGGPRQKFSRVSVCREERRAASQRLQAERRPGERRSRWN